MTGDRLSISGAVVFTQASALKLPVLVELMRQVDAGQQNLDEVATLKASDIVPGSGVLQQLTPEKVSLSLRDIATLMVTVSDNTATDCCESSGGRRADRRDDITASALWTQRLAGRLRSPLPRRGLEPMAKGFERMLLEVDSFLMGASKVHDTLARLARRLKELEIEFALAGGLAIGARGHLRLTVDVDILISASGLARLKQEWLGRGYIEKFPGSRGVKDADTGVSVDFLVSGEYPGDGRPKSVSFPDPSAIPLGDGPYRILDLRTLVELKLASGTSSPDRLVDLADVIALVRANRLSREYAEGLDPSVREKFHELWLAAQTKSDY